MSINIRTIKGKTYVQIGDCKIETGEGARGIREALEIMETQMFLAIIRGEKVHTYIDPMTVKVNSLIPGAKLNTIFTESEEEAV